MTGWYSSSTKLWMKMCAENSKELFKKERLLGEYWPVWLHLKALESMAPCSRLASTQQFWEETPALLSVSDYSPFTLADPPILTTHAVIEHHLPLWFRIDHFYSYESFTHTHIQCLCWPQPGGRVYHIWCDIDAVSSWVPLLFHKHSCSSSSWGEKKEAWISSYFTAYYTLKPPCNAVKLAVQKLQPNWFMVLSE